MLGVPTAASLPSTSQMPFRLQAAPAARPMSVTSRPIQVLAPEAVRHTLCEGCHEAFVLGHEGPKELDASDVVLLLMDSGAWVHAAPKDWFADVPIEPLPSDHHRVVTADGLW